MQRILTRSFCMEPGFKHTLLSFLLCLGQAIGFKCSSDAEECAAMWIRWLSSTLDSVCWWLHISHYWISKDESIPQLILVGRQASSDHTKVH